MPTLLDPDLLRRLLRARDRMTAAPCEGWPVWRLAKVSGVSEAHFARTFKAAFGVPPHRYLLTLRIERAQSLLRGTDRSITEIAMSSGWKSLGTFGRTFQQVVGESPGAFRARQQALLTEAAAIPACFFQASSRPDLRIAVLEKRRQEQGG